MVTMRSLENDFPNGEAYVVAGDLDDLLRDPCSPLPPARHHIRVQRLFRGADDHAGDPSIPRRANNIRLVIHAAQLPPA
jgi:hypothetical protein